MFYDSLRQALKKERNETAILALFLVNISNAMATTITCSVGESIETTGTHKVLTSKKLEESVENGVLLEKEDKIYLVSLTDIRKARPPSTSLLKDRGLYISKKKMVSNMSHRERMDVEITVKNIAKLPSSFHFIFNDRQFKHKSGVYGGRIIF